MNGRKRGTIPDGAWSPHLCGALTGLLLVLSVVVAHRYFGTSSTFSRTAGFLERLLFPGRFGQLEYYARYLPRVDWQSLFVIGIAAGAFLSAMLSSSFRLQAVPDLWIRRFGPRRAPRAAAAFAGGAVAMFGARLAGG